MKTSTYPKLFLGILIAFVKVFLWIATFMHKKYSMLEINTFYFCYTLAVIRPFEKFLLWRKVFPK